MALKNLFKKKPGGTFFGNALRGVTKLAAASGLVPGAGLVSSLLPEAPPFQIKAAQDVIQMAIATPALEIAEVKEIASQAKETMLQAGVSEKEAAAVGAAAFTAASLPPVQAVQALDVATVKLSTAPVNSFGASEIKTIFNGALDGAQSGATDAYLNKTDVGKEQKKGAINAEGAKIMPWVIGTLVGVIAVLFVKKSN